MIEVVLPAPLCKLAGISNPLMIDVAEPATHNAVLDAIEHACPTLRGTIRDYATGRRRAYLRFFACGEDVSHEPPDALLPAAVIAGDEPFLVVGAMSGG